MSQSDSNRGNDQGRRSAGKANPAAKPASDLNKAEASELGRPVGSPGSRLRAAREIQGWSIGDVAAHTKIRPDQLEALENDHYDRLEPLFVRSFLKSYAKAVGLDENSVSVPSERLAVAPKIPPPSQRPASPLLAILTTVLLALAGLGLAGYYVLTGLRALPPTPPPAITAPPPNNGGAAGNVKLSVSSEPSGAEVFVDNISKGRTPLRGYPVAAGKNREVRVSKTGYLSAKKLLDLSSDRDLRFSLTLAPKAAVNPTPAAKKPSITLTVQRESYLRVRDENDQRLLFEGNPISGTVKTFIGPITVRAGRPNAVFIQVNGKSQGTLGDSSAPLTRKVP
jgi:cytoskeleton protein RodZ